MQPTIKSWWTGMRLKMDTFFDSDYDTRSSFINRQCTVNSFADKS